MPSEIPAAIDGGELARELEAIFELTIVGLAHLRDRKIVRCNRVLEQLFGFGPGEMLGQSTRIWYRSDEEFVSIGGSAYPDLAQGRVHSREQYFRRKDGSEFWGRIAGRAPDPHCPTDCVLLIEDTTERKLADERLRQALYEQQSMFDNAAVGILFIRDRTIQRCNRRLEELFCYGAGELIGRSVADFFVTTDDMRQHDAQAYAAIAAGAIFSTDLQLMRKDGSMLWVHLTGRKIMAEDDALNAIWIVEDVSARHQAEAELVEYQETLEARVEQRTAALAAANARLQAEMRERVEAENRVWHVANYDALTSLPNRRLFRDRLHLALAQAKRRHTKIGVLFVDLDRFKSINDTLGHEVGDSLLQEVALRLTAALRAEDTVARLGGDEFVVLLADIGQSADAEQVAENLLLGLSPVVTLEAHALYVTGTIGVSIYPDHGTDAATLMRSADTALYQAKSEGRNTVRVFTPEMNQAANRLFFIESRLPVALEQGEFVLHYQPLVDAVSRQLVGLEALIRWQRDDGMIAPGDFIPVAEESGFILQIGAWVLREACRQAVAWQRAGLRPVTVAVNLSARQFRQPELVELIRTILAESGLAPQWLELEITESTLMDQAGETLARLRQLKEMGIRLAVDDFGTGYSSLSFLRRFPMDRLKIDQSFVRDICIDRDGAAMVSAIIDLACNLGLEPLAEGVESEEQLQALQAAGCKLCQGYYFSRPVPAVAIGPLLTASLPV